MQLSLFHHPQTKRELHPFWFLNPMQKINYRAYLAWSFEMLLEVKSIKGVQYCFHGSSDGGITYSWFTPLNKKSFFTAVNYYPLTH